MRRDRPSLQRLSEDARGTYLDARFLTMIAVVGRLVKSVVCDTDFCNLPWAVVVEELAGKREYVVAT